MAVWPVGGIDMYWVAGILTLLLLGYLIEAMLEPERF
jgi:K+-transporting ATPase KdpF subunit